MRPINLIPAEERRRNRGAGSRSGPLPFLLIGALVLLLAGVLALLHSSNQISDREANVAQLETQKATASARLSELTPYTSFAQVAEQRTKLIAELADDRFDWARVIQQLSLILPTDVRFSSLSASAGGAAEESSSSAPSLSIQGCAPSQNAVAGFVSSLKQIDGVTRVSLGSSSLAGGAKTEASSGTSGASSCASGAGAQFTILVVFDNAPPSPSAGAPTAEEAPAPESTTEGESSEASPESPEEGEATSSASATVGEGGATG